MIEQIEPLIETRYFYDNANQYITAIQQDWNAETLSNPVPNTATGYVLNGPSNAAAVWNDNTQTWTEPPTIDPVATIENLRLLLLTLPVESRDRFYSSGDIPAIFVALQQQDFAAAVYRIGQIDVNTLTPEEIAVYGQIVAILQTLGGQQ